MRGSLDFKMSSRRAVLHVKNLAVNDTFQFGGPSNTPALVDFRVDWRATGPAVPRGKGTTVPPNGSGAWLGEIAPAISTGRFSGDEIGFEFRSDRGASTPNGGERPLHP